MRRRKRILLDAIGVLIRQIARVMFRSGMSYREFSEYSKRAFVDVALGEYGVGGRRTNDARTAAITGLSRRSVKAIRESIETGEKPPLIREAPTSKVLSEWRTNDRYVDGNGSPADLEYESDGPCFSELVRIAGASTTPGAIRAELERAGCVIRTSAGKLRLAKSFYLAADLDERLSRAISGALTAHAKTIYHNTDPANQRKLRADRIVFCSGVGQGDMTGFERVITEKIEKCVLEVSAFVDEYQVLRKDSEAGADELRTAGVGIYFFQDSGK